MSHFSFSLALVLYYSSLYETVHVAWIKINIQCKSFSLNVKISVKYLSGASDRGAVVRL